MPEFKISEILQATGGRLLEGIAEASFSGVSTDSRTIKKDDFFFALKGKNFDGHDFVSPCIDQGVRGFAVSRKIGGPVPAGCSVVLVDDTLAALSNIASFNRKKFSSPIIAVTGSNGKTTTKEMIHQVLSSEFRVLKSTLNHNNQIGLSITLLNLERSYDCSVLELGISHPGEMTLLRDLAAPDIAVFTNIGPTHLEFFGSAGNVLKAKAQLVARFGPRNKLVVNADCPWLKQEFLKARRDFKILSFGIDSEADFKARNIGLTDRGWNFSVERERFFLPVLGRHNIYNALAAISAGSLMGVSLAKISQALEDFRLPSMRLNLEKVGGFSIINDAYNSNPDSLKLAVETLAGIDVGGRKILVCADMLELGRDSEKLHTQMGDFLARFKFDCLLTVGNFARKIGERLSGLDNGTQIIRHFSSNFETLGFLNEIVQPGDCVLVKGSRGMHLEEIIQGLKCARLAKKT